MLKKKLCSRVTLGGKVSSLCFDPYARKRYSAKCDVQLRFAGAACSRGSSSAADPDHGGRGIERTVEIVWANVSGLGRPSIAPEKLLRALLLQLLYSIRSERLLMEQLEYNLLFRWFVGLSVDEPVWVPTVFSKNRDRLLEGEIAAKFFAQVLDQARAHDLLSDEHFSVDGTLIEAWASQKSFQAQGRQSNSAAGRPRQPDGEFSRRKTQQRHASIDHGPASAAGAKEFGARVEAGLLRQRADRESQTDW